MVIPQLLWGLAAWFRPAKMPAGKAPTSSEDLQGSITLPWFTQRLLIIEQQYKAPTTECATLTFNVLVYTT